MSEKYRFKEGPSRGRIITRFIFGAALGIGVLGTAWGSFYQVDENHHAIVTSMGDPARVVLNYGPYKNKKEIEAVRKKYADEGIGSSVGPGLHWKKPFVESVELVDRRLIRWNGFPEDIPTLDKTTLYVDPAGRVLIEDPLAYLRTLRTEQGIHASLDTNVDSSVRNVAQSHNLIELVRTDNRPMYISEATAPQPGKVDVEQPTTQTAALQLAHVGKVEKGRQRLVTEMIAQANVNVQQYGLKIPENGLLLRSIVYIDKVKEAVENRMISERAKIAQQIRSEGVSEVTALRGQIKREKDTLRSNAYREAEMIRGKADEEAAKIYADGFTDEDTEKFYPGFGANPEFFAYLKTLELYRTALGKETRLILGTDNPLFETMKGKTLVQVAKEANKHRATTQPGTQPAGK